MSKFAGLALPIDKTARMTILHPARSTPLRDRDGEEAYIEGYSQDSDIARRHEMEASRRRLDNMGRTKLSPEELDAERTEYLAALITGWRLVAIDGSPIDVPFSAKDARDLLAERSMRWLREQWESHTAQRANFLQPPSAT